jgi:hypothetical protein
MARVRFAIALISILLVSCTPFATLPVEYVSVVPVIADRGALHERAGIAWSISNAGAKEITWLRVAFDLYDETDRPLPRHGANSFYADVTASIASGASASFVTSLDEVFAHAPDTLTVARFRVASVIFADGSRWTSSGTHVYEAGE